jgi:hypothetical protein
MQDFWGAVAKMASLVASLGAVVGLIWYFATLDERAQNLESQLHSLAISPTIIRTGPAQDKSVSPTQSTTPETSVVPTTPETSVVLNPLQQTCADLAARVAKAIEDGHPSSVAEPLQSLMTQIGCGALAKH